MLRGRSRLAMIAAMPPAAHQPPDPNAKLTGNLTVADARHIVACEGGELSRTELVLQLVMTGVVAVAVARAISVGSATVWHVALPSIAQYLVLLVVIPPLYIALRHQAIRKDAISALYWLAAIMGVGAIAVAARAWQGDVPWRERLAADSHAALNWITDAQMHWPLGLAVLGSLIAIPGRVRNLYVHGPPFVGVSLGCAMRFVVLLLGFMALPWAMGDANRMAWTLWTMIVIAELLALWMHWDLQQKLRAVDRGELRVKQPEP